MSKLISKALSKNKAGEIQENMTLQQPSSSVSPPALEDKNREEANVQDNNPNPPSISDPDTDPTRKEGKTKSRSNSVTEEKGQTAQTSSAMKYKEDFSTVPRTEGDLQILSVLDCVGETTICEFSNDGNLLAVGLSDGSIKVFSTDKGELVQTLKDKTSVSSLPVTSLRFRHSEKKNCTLLATYSSGTVRSWYVWDGQCVWSVQEEKDEHGCEEAHRQTLSLAISPSGQQAVTGGSDAALFLYDLNTYQQLQTYKASPRQNVMDGHCLRVFAAIFHPDRETQFISGGWDNTIQFWDTRQQQAVRMIYGPYLCGDALDIDPAASQILSGSWRRNSSIEIWDYGSGKKIAEAAQDPNSLSRAYSCQWFGQDHIIAAGSNGNMLKVMDRHTLMTESKFLGLSLPVFSFSICPSGKKAGLIAATMGERVFLLDRSQMERKPVYKSVKNLK